jgi:hypothetical protein
MLDGRMIELFGRKVEITMKAESGNPAAPQQVETESWRRRPAEGLVEWLQRTAPEAVAMMNDGRTSKELMDELYDEETGLPK